jgi:hypothetical protein
MRQRPHPTSQFALQSKFAAICLLFASHRNHGYDLSQESNHIPHELAFRLAKGEAA